MKKIERKDWAGIKEEQRKREKKIVGALDWNREQYKDRLACVEELDREGRLIGLSPTQLNEVSNYLLYSEDVDCEVELRKPPRRQESYDKMVEDGMADMIVQEERFKNIYKIPRATIDREKDKDIPGMEDLWDAIEKIEKIYRYLDDCLKGRRKEDFTYPIKVSYATHYYYKHWYIDLCTQQYILKDIFKPKMVPDKKIYIAQNKEIEYYFGLRVGPYVINEADEDKMIDLANRRHIHTLMRFYKQERKIHEDEPLSDWNMLYDLIDEAIGQAMWRDELWEVLELKVNGWSNEKISEYVRENYGVGYKDNYISTLFTRSACKKIAQAALLNAKRKAGEVGTKTCIKCKKERWADEFRSRIKTCGYCRGQYTGYGRKLRLDRPMEEEEK